VAHDNQAALNKLFRNRWERLPVALEQKPCLGRSIPRKPFTSMAPGQDWPPPAGWQPTRPRADDLVAMSERDRNGYADYCELLPTLLQAADAADIVLRRYRQALSRAAAVTMSASGPQ
jgi:hypothetical protein